MCIPGVGRDTDRDATEWVFIFEIGMGVGMCGVRLSKILIILLGAFASCMEFILCFFIRLHLFLNFVNGLYVSA